MMKKWMVITGILLLSISQGRNRLSDFLNEIIMRNIDPIENYLLSIPLLFLMEIINGFLNILDSIWQFFLSWEGVLLILVILLYLSIREYIKRHEKT